MTAPRTTLVRSGTSSSPNRPHPLPPLALAQQFANVIQLDLGGGACFLRS